MIINLEMISFLLPAKFDKSKDFWI